MNVQNFGEHSICQNFKDREFSGNDHSVAFLWNDAQGSFPSHEFRVNEIAFFQASQSRIRKLHSCFGH